MIKIVAEEYLTKAPNNAEQFYFTISELMLRNNNNLKNYLLTVYGIADYVINLSKFINTITEKRNELTLKLNENSKNYHSSDFYIFRVDGINSNQTYKEQDAYDRIYFGKEIFQTAKRFLQNNISYSPKWLNNYITSVTKKIEDFNNINSPTYKITHEKSFNYENVLAGEDDIYYDIPVDLANVKIFNELKKYLSPQKEFINSGNSYFAIDDYLYEQLFMEPCSLNEIKNLSPLLNKLVLELKELKEELSILLPAVPQSRGFSKINNQNTHKKEQDKKAFSSKSKPELIEIFKEEYPKLFMEYPFFLETLQLCKFKDGITILDKNYCFSEASYIKTVLSFIHKIEYRQKNNIELIISLFELDKIVKSKDYGDLRHNISTYMTQRPAEIKIKKLKDFLDKHKISIETKIILKK